MALRINFTPSSALAELATAVGSDGDVPVKSGSGFIGETHSTTAEVSAAISSATADLVDGDGAVSAVAADIAGGGSTQTAVDARVVVGRPEGVGALTISGTGDSLTASTNFATTAASAKGTWTGSPSGDITITTDLADGQTGELVLTPGSGKAVALSQSSITFTVINAGTAYGDISGDGSTVYVITMHRVGTVVEYSVGTR